MTDKYAIVTAVSSFRIRYAIPIREGENAKQLLDLVTCSEVEEFSQLHLGEQISDVVEMTENEMLELFDKDNDYLKSWTREEKVSFVNRLRAEDM